MQGLTAGGQHHHEAEPHLLLLLRPPAGQSLHNLALAPLAELLHSHHRFCNLGMLESLGATSCTDASACSPSGVAGTTGTYMLYGLYKAEQAASLDFCRGRTLMRLSRGMARLRVTSSRMSPACRQHQASQLLGRPGRGPLSRAQCR